MIEIPKKIFEIYDDCLGSNNIVVGRLFAAKIRQYYSEWLSNAGISIRYLSWLVKNRYTRVIDDFNCVRTRSIKVFEIYQLYKTENAIENLNVSMAF